jgi:hypothetical protein
VPTALAVIRTSDPEAAALRLAETEAVDLVDGGDDAIAALTARVDALARPLLGDPVRAARAAAASAALDAARVALGGAEPLDPSAAAFAALLPVTRFDLEEAAEERVRALARVDAAQAASRQAAEPPPPPAALVTLAVVHPELLRERARAALTAADAAAAAQAALSARVDDRTLLAGAARLAVTVTDRARLAVAIARPRALGGVAFGIGGVLIVHSTGIPFVADALPVAVAALLSVRLRRGAAAALDAAMTERRRLRAAGFTRRGDLDRYEEDRAAWVAGLDRVRTADEALGWALVRWHDLAGDHDPEAVEALINAAIRAARTVAGAPMRAAARDAAAEDLRQAELEQAAIDAALSAELARLGLAGPGGPTGHAIVATLRERTALVDHARASMAFHTAARLARLTSTGDDAEPPAHLVLCDPIPAGSDNQRAEVIELLARIQPPLRVTYVTADDVFTRAAAAAGLPVVVDLGEAGVTAIAG